MENDSFNEILNGYTSNFAEPNPEPAAVAEEPKTPNEVEELRSQLAEQKQAMLDMKAQFLAAPTFQQQNQPQPQYQAPPPPRAPQKSPEEMLAESDQQFYVSPTKHTIGLMQQFVADELKKHLEPLRQETTSRSVSSFLSEQKQSDPMFSRVEPEFKKMVADPGTQKILANMSQADRDSAYSSMYDAALGRAFRNGLNKGVESGKLAVTPAPNYGAGIAPVRPAAAASSVPDLDASSRMAYERMVADGMASEDALNYLRGDE